MWKCTSFPSLVVLKHIHMSSMFPFLLLPLLSPFLSSPPPWSSCFYFPTVKNGCTLQMDDMTHWSGVFLLLSCCWLSRLTVWQIQFGVLGRVEVITTEPELWVEMCANRGSCSVSTPRTLEHTHTQTWGELLSCVGRFFNLFSSLSLSLSLPQLEKTDLF